MQTRFIEKYIEEQTGLIEDAYLLIDVQIKNGTEPVSAALKKEIERTTAYLGLHKYLENNTVDEIWLTDDFINFEDKSLDLFLRLLSGKDILAHICVDETKVPIVKNNLKEALDRGLDKGFLFLRWQYEDKSYVIELLRRCDKSKYILRIYENGFGVIVLDTISDVQITYFNVEEEYWNEIVAVVEKRVLDIIEHPEEAHEDDRDYLPVHLRYGLTWKVPEAEDLLGKYEVYEDSDYSTTEDDIPLALKLLMIPEVKKVWPEPEKSTGLFAKSRKRKMRKGKNL